MRRHFLSLLLSLWVAPGVQAQPPFPVLRESLTPQRAVQIALLYSPDPAIARVQVRMRQAEREQAASSTRLKVNLGFLGSAQSEPMIYSTGADPAFLQTLPDPGALNLNAMAMLPIYTGGLLEHRLQAAEKAERGAEARESLAVLQTAREVRTAFFSLGQQQAQQRTLAWEVEARGELLRLAQQRLMLGKVARYVVLRAEADVAEVRQRHNELAASLEEGEARLKSLLGVSLASQFTYPGQVDLPPAPAPLEEVLRQAYADRPDLVSARFAVEQGDSDLLAALADFSPKVYAVAMAGAMRVDPFRSSPTGLNYSVGLVVSFPLYDGGLRQAQTHLAEQDVEMRKLQLQKLQLEVQQQVASARSRLVTAVANAELAQAEVEKAREENRLAQLRFALGRGLYLEVLDGVTLQSRAESNQIRAQYQAKIQQAELDFLTGRPL